MILRALPFARETVFLTFDDGPDPVGTPAVLDLLKEKQVAASFFLIADKIPYARELVHRIHREGHAIGNHSIDHKYRNYLRGRKHLREWLLASQRALAAEGLTQLVGFRPPAGILTPPLARAAQDLGLPVVLWNERFYDAVIPWSEGRAVKSAKRLQGGSIVLLHDRQSAGRLPSFLKSLASYIETLHSRGFKISALPTGEQLAKHFPRL